MSSRAFRRLHGDADIIKLPAVNDEDIDSDEESNPTLQPQKRKTKTVNPFELLLDDGEEEGNSDHSLDDENTREEAVPLAASVTPKRTKKKKKKKKKNSPPVKEEPKESIEQSEDEVDVAIKEVSQMLGGLETTGPENIASDRTLQHVKSLLCVNRRYLNADNEMRRIFGSRVVRAEQSHRRDHKRKTHKQTILVTPKDTWPLVEKLGLSMQLVEVANSCHYFMFEHSQDYQKIQFSFLDATETYDPNAIGAVLHAHPYHIDSLLQLSEVCKMGEDMQMAADLIERALYQFECSFHPLFNVTQDNCRLSYTRSENRSFFIGLFRHLNYVERKGCHRTAFELCKLVLSLDPETDPLCILLMIDYLALRACEYQFLIDLQRLWESKKNLTQLPNFAFSVPLAMFLLASDNTSSSGRGGDDSGCGLLEEANKAIQESLMMFPSLLIALLDKSSATLEPSIMSHALFSRTRRVPDALQLLIRLYVERTHSLWKAPEVLEWLGSNALDIVKRDKELNSHIQECEAKRQKRYVGTPRNISRHVILSDLDNTTSTLPRDVTGTPIMMYDPLPPQNTTSGYTRPPRSQRIVEEDPSNPLMLFLRSLLPSFDQPTAEGNQPRLVGVANQGPHPNQQQEQPLLPGVEGGAVGGGIALENAVQQLTTSLRGLLQQLQTRTAVDSDDEEGSQESD